MAAIDKLVIEITGDASGLTKALSQSQKNLTSFNANVIAGNRAINTFVGALTKGAGAAGRLAATVNEVKSTFTGLNRNVSSTASAIGRLGSSARTANNDIKSFASQLSKLAGSFERISGASKSAQAAINSLQRRVAALGTTVSAVNGNMRTFNRTVEMGTAGARAGGIIVNNYGRNLEGAGGSANRASGMFSRLNKANITLMEGFRRHVAQITALRTLTYQAIFWFSPLIYSIIKVNAQYEKQMQLLKNLSGIQDELGKQKWAEQTYRQLIQLANTNPFSLGQITNTFVRMKVTGLDPLNGSLQTLMDSIAAFGGGNEELERAGIALQQMVGKSAVSMEELRQQLGEHIPDAMSAMAKGMGLSMAEFYKQVQHGTVESRNAIAKMIAVLANDHYNAAKNMMNTWNGLLARMGTAWQTFVAHLEHGNNGNTFIKALKEQVEDLIRFLNTPAGVVFAHDIENSLINVVHVISSVIKLVYEWRDVIVIAAKTFAVFWGGRLIIGSILGVISTFVKLRSAIQLTILVLAALRGGLVSAQAAAVAMGVDIKLATTATNMLGGAAGTANARLLTLIGTFVRSATAAGILAGSIWMIVNALNAKTLAERNEALAQAGAEGTPWKDDKERAAALTDLRRQKFYRDKGLYVDTSGNIPRFHRWDDKAEERYQNAIVGYNQRQEVTRNITSQNINQRYSDYLEKGNPISSVESFWLNQKKDVTDPKQRQALELQQARAMAGAASNYLMTLEHKRDDKSLNPDQRQALEAKILEVQRTKDSYDTNVTALSSPNVSIAGNKKGKKNKTKKNPLEGAENSFANEHVRTADLEHQYEDLKNNTSTEFDGEAALKEGQRLAGLIKTKEALKLARQAERDRQEELKKSIKVEQAIHDIEDKKAETEAELHEGLEDLTTSYVSVSSQANRYRETLEREKKIELQIVEARMATGNATQDQIRQYVALKEAINGAVRAKQAELVVEAAKEAKSANEDYYATLRSPIQQADYESRIEKAKYQDALNNAIALANNEKIVDEELASAKAQLLAQTKKLSDAGKTQNEIESDAIVISAKRTITQDEETKSAIASIPYLQERIRILQEEDAIRHKWNGAGGPMLDWAKKASADFTDLGASMGNVLTGAMDDFINGLAEGKLAFKDFAKTVLKQLLLIIIRGLIAKAIMSALGLGGASTSVQNADISMTGVDQSVASGAGILHSGGIVGSSGMTRTVDPALFTFAKRYHTGGIVGLRDNEYPIIAERGEGVFTKEQMTAMGETNKGSNVQVNVINQTGVQADAEHKGSRFDGEKWVETIVLKKIATAGPIRDALTAVTKRNR